MKFKNKDGKFELLDDSLRQLLPGESSAYTYREVTRKSIARFFAGVKPRLLLGRYEHWTKSELSWTARLVGVNKIKRLMIGCVAFTPAQTAKIRQWAQPVLTKRRKTTKRSRA